MNKGTPIVISKLIYQPLHKKGMALVQRGSIISPIELIILIFFRLRMLFFIKYIKNNPDIKKIGTAAKIKVIRF